MVLSRVRSWRRERALGSDDRAGRYARARARRAQRSFARRNWRMLTGLVVVGYVPVLVSLVFLPGGFLRGFAAGAGTAAVIGAAASYVVQASGTGPQLMGDLAEQWTASELRPLRKRGWKLVNHVSLRPWDIDHVLVGPGGVVAIETKWSAAAWEMHPPSPRVRDAVRRTAGNARDLALWTPVRRCGAPSVTPLVVLWGPVANDEDLGPVIVDGVAVLHGRALAPWRDGQTHRALSEDHVQGIWAALEAQARDRDARRASGEQVPPSVAALLLRLFVLITIGLAGFATSAKVLEWTGSLPVWTTATLALLALGLALRTTNIGRYPGLAWATGCAAALALGPIAYLISRSTT